MTEENLDRLKRQLTDLEAKRQAMLARPLTPPLAPVAGRDRQTKVFQSCGAAIPMQAER
jgi:hypothetical protein